MKAILVDDESSALITLKHKLLKYPNIEVIATISDPEEAISIIDRLVPDVIFLDIDMPVMSGFDLLQHFSSISFEVIFITAHDEFTIDAIRISAFDYLLKPVDEEDLQKTLTRLTAKLIEKKAEDHKNNLLNLIKALGLDQPKIKKIAVGTAEGLILVPVSEIVRLAADGAYTTIILKDKRKITASKALGYFESICSNSSFFKVHRSHIINMDCVEQYIRGEGGSVILSDGSEIGVSRAVKSEFLSKLLKQS